MNLISKKLHCLIIILALIRIPDAYGYSNQFLFDVETPKAEVYSPTKIVWDTGTLQIYDGTSKEPIHEFKDFQSPAVVDLENGSYTFKRWKGEESEAFNVNILEPINAQGMQLDENEWVTVPGDACKPMINDLEELYKQYETYVAIDNNESASQTTVIADGKSHMEDNANSMSSPFIMHNITYLRKVVPQTLKGVHLASYSLRIPSFATGITAEGGLFVWSHLNQKNYGVAFQLIVDQNDPNFGKIYYYGGSKGWIDSTNTLDLATDTFYEIKFILDVTNREADIIISHDDNTIEINNVFHDATKDGWSTTSTLAHLQAECISKDGVRHAVIFKDYSWCHDVDMDNESQEICEDDCPLDPEKTEPGMCGCGKYEPDFFEDDIVDLKDAIVVLKVLTDGDDITFNADLVSTIGMKEAVYTLKCIGGGYQ
jgi:hypothetical protein